MDSDNQDTGDRQCPECGAELEPIVTYIRNLKTSDGWRCTECGYEDRF